MSSVSTRRAEKSDLPELVFLFAQFRDSLGRTTPTSAELEASLARLMLDSGYACYLAIEAGRGVGYAATRFVFSAWSGGTEAVLEDLFVSDAFRGRTLGRRLVELAIQDATALGCRSMSLDTNENNIASNALYRRLGFTCARARWGGGRQIRYDLRLGST